jgi:hypothetical protein
MSREKSNRDNNRGERRSNRGDRQNVSSRRGPGTMNEDSQKRITEKGGRSSHSGSRGRSIEESDRSE